VRRAVNYKIALENPLSIPASFNIHCESEDITAPATVTVGPNAEGGFELIYLPLLVYEKSVKLRIASPQLGEYIYALNLKSTQGKHIC
jgi:hypothetical protein